MYIWSTCKCNCEYFSSALIRELPTLTGGYITCLNCSTEEALIVREPLKNISSINQKPKPSHSSEGTF